jgi:hypothetical protein
MLSLIVLMVATLVFILAMAITTERRKIDRRERYWVERTHRTEVDERSPAWRDPHAPADVVV